MFFIFHKLSIEKKRLHHVSAVEPFLNFKLLDCDGSVLGNLYNIIARGLRFHLG